jgi:hypothetical protein
LNHIRSALGIGRVSLNQQELVLWGAAQDAVLKEAQAAGLISE